MTYHQLSSKQFEEMKVFDQTSVPRSFNFKQVGFFILHPPHTHSPHPGTYINAFSHTSPQTVPVSHTTFLTFYPHILPSHSTLTFYPHILPSHSTIMFYPHILPSHSTLTFYRHILPSHSTVTFYPHILPSCSILTFYRHDLPSDFTLKHFPLLVSVT